MPRERRKIRKIRSDTCSEIFLSDIAYVHSMKDYARLGNARHTSRNLISWKTSRSTRRHFVEVRNNILKAKRTIKPPSSVMQVSPGITFRLREGLRRTCFVGFSKETEKSHNFWDISCVLSPSIFYICHRRRHTGCISLMFYIYIAPVIPQDKRAPNYKY